MRRAGLFSALMLAASVVMTGAAQAVFAQDQQSSATTFVQGQSSTLTAPQTFTPSATSVPGYAGDATDLQSYSSNPSGMESAGNSAAASNSQYGLISDSVSTRPNSAVDVNADWLKSSLGVSTDPMAQAGGSAGSDQSSCKEVTKDQTSTETSLYTCESSKPVTDTANACRQILIVETETLYKYACTNTYDQGQKKWVISTACLALSAATPDTCTKTGEKCDGPAKPYFQAQSCVQGTQWSSEEKTCTTTRSVVVDTDYLYACSNTYNQATRQWVTSSQCSTLGAASPNCVKQSQNCSGTAPPYYSNLQCVAGAQWTSADTTCTTVRQLTIDTDYIYNCAYTYDAVTKAWTPSAACSALASSTPNCSKTGETCLGYSKDTSCVAGTQWTSAAQACSMERQVVVDTDYVYGCSWTYNQATRAWGPSAECATLNSQTPANCTKQSETCVQASTPYYQPKSCQAGTQYNTTTQSCDLVRTITVDTDYVYNGNRNWNGASYVDDGPEAALRGAGTCQIQATTCASGSGLPPTYSCTEGYTGGTVGGTCTNAPYEAPTYQYWGASNGGTWSLACNKSVQDLENWMSSVTGGHCHATGMSVADNNCNSVKGQVPYTSFTGGWKCDAPLSTVLNRAMVKTFSIGTANGLPSLYINARGDNPSYGFYTAFQLMAGPNICSQRPATCVVQDSGNVEYGSTICTTQTNAPGCAPPAGMVLQSQTCSGSTGGTCTQWDKTYVDPTGGCSRWTDQWLCPDAVAGAGSAIATPKKIVGEVYASQCTALESNAQCRLDSQAVVEGPATRNIDGLDVSRDDWRVRRSFTCFSPQAVDTCTGAVTGCTETSRTCAGTDRNGACSLWNINYSCPADDGSGNCSKKDLTYLCGNAVGGAGAPLSTPKRVVSESWSNACDSLANNSSCSVASETGTNGGTRTIDGLAVTRDPWTINRSYTCWTSKAVDSCSGQTTGCTQTNKVCAGNDRSGACSQWTYTYSCPADASTGTCSSKTATFYCEDPVTAGGAPTSTPKSVATETWSTACNALAADSSCSLKSTIWDSAGTQVWDGLPVTRDHWAENRTYTCWNSTPIDGCAGKVTGCTQTAKVCAGNGRDGTCSQWTYTYSCPADDGSGNCSKQDLTYLCGDAVSGVGSPIATPKKVVSESWSTGCDTLANDSTCDLKAETTDGSSTRTIDGLAVTRDPWTKNRTYACWKSQPIDGCTGNVTGCTQTGKTCAGNGRDGQCSVWTYTYSCPADDGSGNCSSTTSTYTCTADIPAADPAQSIETRQTGSHWQYDGTCPAAEDTACTAQDTVCTEGPATRTVNGISVQADCWAKQTNYMCQTLGEAQNNCAPPKDCTWSRDECLDDPAPANGACVTVQHVYQCSTSTTTQVTETQCTDKLCLGDQCFSSQTQANNELPQTFAQLSAMNQAGKDYAGDVSIMKGSKLRCRKSVLGFSNCCKDSGWGQDIGLASCDAQEKQLIEAQKNKSTHYVGTYCSKKSFFGACLEKSMSYCSFQGSLGRIINEAGRPQIGKGWGEPKNPDCSGFTVEQFQQLDLTNVDFSDFYKDKMGALTSPDGSSTVNRIQDSLTNMYNSSSQGPGV
jgi:hypothetical protein